MTEHNESQLEHAVESTVDKAGAMVGKAEANLATDSRTFVQAAGISDKYEVEAGKIALKRSQSEEVRDAARRMIDDHTEATTKLKKAVMASQKITSNELPAELDKRRSQMIEHLRDAPADKFDKTYLDQQVAAHEEAVDLMHTYRKDGDCVALRGFADEMSPVIESHLEHMKKIASA